MYCKRLRKWLTDAGFQIDKVYSSNQVDQVFAQHKEKDIRLVVTKKKTSYTTYSVSSIIKGVKTVSVPGVWNQGSVKRYINSL